MPGIRLQRVLASGGIGSRRACEQLILDGRVEVDGVVVTELGTRVEIAQQVVRVDGVTLRQPRKRYYAVNKPKGVVSTKRDPERRPRVIDLVPQGELLFTVGRLDRHSEGLILVTNDGELCNQLAHPRHGVEKTYRVEVAGQPTPETLDTLRRGVHLAEGVVQASIVRVVQVRRQSTILEIVLQEGKNREIRRMAAGLGHKVLQLRRIAIGPLKLGDLPVGAYRELSPVEIKNLRETAAGRRRDRMPQGEQEARPSKDNVGQRRGTRRIGGRPSGGRHSGGRPSGGRPSGGRPRGKRPAGKTPRAQGTSKPRRGKA